MIVLLLLALAPRDEMTDLITRLRAAPPAEQFRLGVQVAPLAKPAHLPLLAKETDAGPENLRPHFIRAIGRVGGREAQTVLRGLCMRNDFASRAEAAAQLTYLQDDVGQKVLVELLPKAATDAEKLAVLSHLYGKSEGVPALLKFLEKETADGVRRQAVRVLCSCWDAAAALPAIRRIAADPKDAGRYDALAELIRRGDDAAIDAAIKGLENKEADWTSMYSILNAIEEANKKAVLPRLRELLEKTDDRTLKVALIRTLATMKDDKALPLLTKLSDDQDPAIAKVALESVIRLSGRAQMETIKKATDDPDPLKKLEAAEALLQMDSPEGWTALRAALQDATPAVKTRAMSILSGQRRREAVDLLIPYLEDPQEYVRNSARASIVATLNALNPYLKFDDEVAPAKLRAWWEKNRRN
jgi:HEAT repeat protein